MKYFYCVLILFCFSIQTKAQVSPEVLNDSAMAVYKVNPQKAIAILKEALKTSESKKNKLHIAKTKNNLGIVYRDLGRFEEAKALSQEALKVSDSIILASAYNNIGVINRNLALYDEALESYFKALDIYEAKQMLKEKATVNNSIGMVYSFTGFNDKAIDYHLKAKTIFEELNNKKGISEVYNNIAIIYANDGDLEKALDYFKYSLEIEESLNDKKGIAESANNVGAVYYYMGNIDEALKFMKQSIKMEKSINNQGGLASSYNNIADVLIENSRLNEAKVYIDSAYYYANLTKVAVDVESALHNYSKYYEAKNDTDKALKYYKRFTLVRDSILNLETNSKLAELDVQYQTEKKEKEILSQRADLAEKELNLNQKNTQLLGLGVLAVVLSLLGYLFYSQQKLKNKQLQKENELKDALIKIETQNRLQEQRLRISRDLHDNIGAQLTFIISSIDNLKYGFKLPDKLGDKLKNISEFTTTTIYELRDTIWAMNKSEITLEDLQSRISNFIDKANTFSKNTNFKFETDSKLNKELTFSSVVGMNIYRIIQEAVNNAIKYASSNEIKVMFKDEDNFLKIKINDDGVGFDTNTITYGNGLNNMKKRANDIGATIDISSKTNHAGTLVEFSLPLKYTTNDV